MILAFPIAGMVKVILDRLIRYTTTTSLDTLDLRVQLVGQSNRGQVAVDGFGFWVTSDDELNRMFGIRSL